MLRRLDPAWWLVSLVFSISRFCILWTVVWIPLGACRNVGQLIRVNVKMFWICVKYVTNDPFWSLLMHREIEEKLYCCIFWPAFGCYAPQTLVEIVVFNVFCAKYLKNHKKYKFGKKTFFLSLHQKACRLCYSQDRSFFILKTKWLTAGVGGNGMSNESERALACTLTQLSPSCTTPLPCHIQIANPRFIA